MAERPEARKIYDEKSVAAILKRASQLQASSSPEGGFGLSLEELQQIASDAGIDPRYVSLAASEFIPVEDTRTNWWGGPLSFSLEWTVDGEIDEVAWEEIVAETRRHFKDTGEVRSWSNSKEWAHSGQNAVQAHITATARGGLTRIQLFWAEPALAVAAYVPLLVLSLILLPIVFEALALSGLVGAATWFAGAGLLFLVARWFMTQIAGGKKRSLAELKGRLERIATESMRLSPAEDSRQTVSEPETPQRLTLDDERDAPELEEPERQTRSRERN